MLEDRDYMRADYKPRIPRPSQWTASVTLMVVLVICFIAQCINDVYVRSPAELSLALTSGALGRLQIWQLLTFQFLHVSLWHLLGNLVGLWFIGRFVENVLGTSRFLVAYFGAGVAGGILQAILMLVFPNHFAAYVVGASAGVMGIFAIFALLARDSTVRLYFVLPIRADVLLWITAAISLFFTVVPSGRGGGMAHAAHLGGLIAGWWWVRLGWHRDYVKLPWEEAFRKWKTRSKASPPQQRPAPHLRVEVKPQKEEEAEGADYISREVDPILEKINAKGIQSLTDRERKILEEARKRMGRT